MNFLLSLIKTSHKAPLVASKPGLTISYAKPLDANRYGHRDEYTLLAGKREALAINTDGSVEFK